MKKVNTLFVLFSALMIFGIGFSQENSESNESIAKDSSIINKVHLSLEATSNEVSVGGEIQLQYTLYVSHDVGVSNWKLIEIPSYSGFDHETIKIDQMEIFETNYQGQPYRAVILRKDKIRSLKEGEFDIKPLQLQITLEVANKRAKEDVLGASMEDVTTVIASKPLEVIVKS